MNCKKFEHWLLARSITDNVIPSLISDHMDACPDCRKLFHMDQHLENQIKSAFELKDIPSHLHDRIEMTLDQAASAPKNWAPYRWAALCAACLAAFILVWTGFFNQPFRYPDIQQFSHDAVQKHLKSDLAMTFDADQMEQATLLFNKELKFNVVLPDIQTRGYYLIGGRLCAVGRCRAAYLFYKKDQKICSLFILDYDRMRFEMADGSRFTNTVKGCKTEIWKEKGQVYALVQGIL